MALWTGLLLLASGAYALDPVFTNDTGGGTQEIKVCVLTMRANQWENSEPWALPVLAGSCNPTVAAMESMRPANWRLVNPLAPSSVTQDIANMWNKAYNGPITYDGQTATVQNDLAGNGNSTPAAVTVNQNKYTAQGGAGNDGGPTTYKAHCSPQNLADYGVGGNLISLPAVGQPIPASHPAYWEVPLTARTVSQLANFDVVLLNTQRNLQFTAEEQQLLRQFLDMGGTLYFENSHGCRIEVLTGSKVDPAATNFFFHFQFVDNFPTFGASPPTRPDGYPFNATIFTSISNAWTAPNPSHALLNGIQSISTSEVSDLGDVQWHDQLLLRGSPGNYLAETVLQCNYNSNYTPFPPSVPEPAVAVARIGSGKLIMSGIDVMEDVHKSYNNAPDLKFVPDMKWMLNVLGWHASLGGNRRGGPSNQGVAAGSSVHSLVPRFVWNAPQGGLNVAGAGLGDGSIHTLAQNASLNTDGNYGLKEPLCAANGIVYVQYQNSAGGNYFVAAIDSKPEVDRDGDGSADDGITDYSSGAPFDTLWVRDMGAEPVRGASVVSLTHIAKQRSCDVLLTTQMGNNQVRLRATLATVDNTINNLAPVETPGTDFYNWTSAAGAARWAGGTGEVDLTVNGVIRGQISAPVAYDDTVFVVGSYNPAAAAYSDPGGWAKVFAVRMVPDPSKSLPAGQLKWCYPDDATYTTGEKVLNGVNAVAGGSASRLEYLLGDTLKQVDLQHYPSYGAWGTAPGVLASHGPSWARLAIDDTTHLLPVVARVTDSRTGLTVPTVFLNRANGDAWAVSADPDALGWHIDGPLPVTQPVGLPTITIGATQLNNAVGQAEWTFDVDPTNPTVAKSADVVVRNTAVYRDAVWYTDAILRYKHTNRGDVVETRPIVPRHRLLRTNRESGFETAVAGSAENYADSFGAPMLWDSETLVTTSSPLYYGSDGEAQAVTGNAAAVGGTATASGPVTFLDAKADSLQTTDFNQNHFDAVRWVFDPGTILPGTSPLFGSWGAAVKYNNSVVVAGSIIDGANPKRGAVIALDPNPSFTGAVAVNGSSLTSLQGHRFTLIDPEQPVAGPRVISPTQYTLDFAASTISLRPDQAHMTRWITPAGTQAAIRKPLYGRKLTLVDDATGNFGTVYIPSPVRWAYLPGAILLDSRQIPTITNVKDSAGATVTFAQDTTRPQLLTFTSNYGSIVTVNYSTPSGGPTSQRYRIGAFLPGFSFSPVVGGDRLFISGTQIADSSGGPAVVNGAGTGGLMSFWYGSDDHVVTQNNLRPDNVPGWSNATATTVASSQVRGIPLPTDDGLFVSFDIVDTAGTVYAPLYGIGGSQLLVTESMRLSRLSYDGEVQWQLTGMKVQNGAGQPTQQVQYNPAPSELQTLPISRPSRAYNLSGDQVLLVDTGNNRVVQTSSTGLVLWPMDTRLNGANLSYYGLRDFGLSRPTDAARFQLNLPGGPPKPPTRDVTVVADRGNRRLVAISSYQRSQGTGTQTYYDALAGQKTDNAGGFGIELTAPQVYNAGTKQWVDLPYVEVQAWNPDGTEPKWSTDPAWTNDELDTYIVARVDGSDQLFNVSLFPLNNGGMDVNGDGKADGIRLSMGQMLDRWSNGTIFRGLKAFRRFTAAGKKFLAVVMSGDDGRSKVVIYQLSPSLIANAANGIVNTNLMWPTGLSAPWTFDYNDYRASVYDSAGAGTAFYERQGAPAQDRLNWWANGQKGWNPLSVSKLSGDNVLAIVNGASNSVNQTGSNSEVLLVRFDPNTLGNKSVEHVLPDLSSTANYPASVNATRTRPSTGSYPLSSPVYATQ